ncbi:hypothetical protein ACLOAU_16360 [Niabella sp. CJ426]|uniref:virginiamycin B lyase family protein n=1 Tax=Niabella sp. CJ426 TaxID=3393740 RepID=UPI003D05DAC7
MNKSHIRKRAALLLCFGTVAGFVHAQYGSPFSNLATTGSGSSPMGLTIDAANNLYVSNYNTGSISKITQAGVVSTFATSVGARLDQMTIDNAGNIYAVSSTGSWSSSVKKVTPTGSVSTLANVPGGGLGPTGTIGIAVDKTSGNIYTTDNTGNTVSRITPAGVLTSFTVGSKPIGIALDGAGNIYTANWGSNTVSKLSPAGTLLATYPVGPNPWGVTIEPVSGNIYVSNAGPYDGGGSPSPNGTVSKITPAGVVTTTWATVGNAADAITTDAAGNVYVVNSYGGTVSEITPAGVVTTLNLPTASGTPQTQLYPWSILISSGRAYVAVSGTDMVAATPLVASLPVTFGSINATQEGDMLSVNWQTVSETNNDHFDIEVSQDGVHFVKAGTVTSNAVNGNSHKALRYVFTTPLHTALSLAGLSVLALGIGLLAFNRKNKLLMLCLIAAGTGLFTVSCSRNSDLVDTNKEANLSVRIAQVDKDGKKSYSPVVKVIRK